MAEFCLECLNRINETKEPAIKYIMSEELNLCEGCVQWKRTVSMYRLSYWLWKLRFIIAPFKFIGIAIYITIKLPWVLWQVYRERKNKKDIQ